MGVHDRARHLAIMLVVPCTFVGCSLLVSVDGLAGPDIGDARADESREALAPTQSIVRGPLTALADGTTATTGNGVYAYSAQPLTTPPSSTYKSSNYFVDVAFRPAP